MFGVVQFPIADFRRLGGLGEIPWSPTWPPRVAVPRQFVRHFGVASPRYRGVDRAWADESSFCKANRALRLPELPHVVRCAFRRLLSDGEAVARVEVGLGFETDALVASGKLAPKPAMDKVLGFLLQLPAQVRPGKAGSDLIRQGRALANLYLLGTSGTSVRPSDLARSMNSLAGIGAPMAILETSALTTELPPGYHLIDAGLPSSLALAFGRHETAWGSVDAWILLGNEPQDLVRGLRICLLRLHAEQQVLAGVLQRCSTDQIRYEAGTPAGDRLEAYFNRATRVIEREQWGAIPQSRILAAFDAIERNEASEAGRIQLAGKLEAVRRQVRVKVERFEQRSSRVINVFDGGTNVENQTNETYSATVTGNVTGNVVAGKNIQGSFNTLPPADRRELEDLLQQLQLAVDQAKAGSKGKESVKLAQQAELLQNELKKDKPQREWYEVSLDGLKEAALAVGELGAPIVQVTQKLLPLLARLWP